MSILMKLVNTPTEISLTTLIFINQIISYQIPTESIRLQLVINIKQSGTGRDLIVPTLCTGLFLSFFFLSSLRHSMYSTEMPLSIFSVKFSMKSETRINITLCSSYLQQKFWLKNNGKFYGSQNFNSSNVSFAFPYISWDKYHHAPILFMVVLLSTYV